MTGEIDLTPGRVLGDTELVDNAKLNDLGRPVLRIKAGAVGTREMADGIITADKLDEDLNAQLGVADNSVTTAKILDLAVTAAKLASDAAIENLPSGGVVQMAYAEYSVASSNSSSIPLDDSIPQNTEGAEFITCSITPKFSSSYLLVQAAVPVAPNGGISALTLAIFRDSAADAIFAAYNQLADSYGDVMTGAVRVAASSTTTTTFKVRLGKAGGSANFDVNGRAGGRLYGGVQKATLVVTEIKG